VVAAALAQSLRGRRRSGPHPLATFVRDTGGGQLLADTRASRSESPPRQRTCRPRAWTGVGARRRPRRAPGCPPGAPSSRVSAHAALRRRVARAASLGPPLRPITPAAGRALLTTGTRSRASVTPDVLQSCPCEPGRLGRQGSARITAAQKRLRGTRRCSSQPRDGCSPRNQPERRRGDGGDETVARSSKAHLDACCLRPTRSK
jgi:hypothetical protein